MMGRDVYQASQYGDICQAHGLLGRVSPGMTTDLAYVCKILYGWARRTYKQCGEDRSNKVHLPGCQGPSVVWREIKQHKARVVNTGTNMCVHAEKSHTHLTFLCCFCLGCRWNDQILCLCKGFSTPMIVFKRSFVLVNCWNILVGKQKTFVQTKQLGTRLPIMYVCVVM